MERSAYVLLAKALSPYSIKGVLHLKLYCNIDTAYAFEHWLWLAQKSTGSNINDQHGRWLECRKIYPPKSFSVSPHVKISFYHIDSLDQAKTLTNGYLYGRTANLPLLAKNEFYWKDVLGCQVVNRQGILLGDVVNIGEIAPPHAGIRIKSSACQQYLCIRKPPLSDSGHSKQELMIPMIQQYIDNVDIQKNLITVDWETDW